MKLIIVRGPGALQRKAILPRKAKNAEKIGLKPNLGGDCLRRRKRSHQRRHQSAPSECASEPVHHGCAQQKINIISAYTHCTSHRTNAWFVITSVSYFIPKAHNSSFIKHRTREASWAVTRRVGGDGKWKRYDNIFFILVPFENRGKSWWRVVCSSLACLSYTKALRGRMAAFVHGNL